MEHSLYGTQWYYGNVKRGGERMKSRTYEVDQHANDAKLRQIRELLPVWQSCLVAVQLVQTRRLREGKPLGWLTADELKPLQLPLSSRQLKSVTNQVNAALRSWQALTVRNVRSLIREREYSDTERHELNHLNVTAAWWTDPRGVELVTESLRTIPFPNLGHTRTMLMDSTVCAASESDTDTFDTWLKVSTLHKGNPVYIPMTHSDYFRSRDGVEAGVTQVRVDEDGAVRLSRVKQSPAAEPRDDGDVIGLDWGLSSALFATSDGRLLGTRMYSWLKQRDIELTELTASLQRQGIRPRDSRRFRNLTRRIREYVRNEVNRVLNRIAASEVRELVVEKLDFRGGGLSRRMNRILSRAGRAAVRAKLAALTEDTGIAVTEVNPAYTSQQCCGCGFVSEKNRTSQSRFACRFCGMKRHADINGARTIANRRSVRGDGFAGCSKRIVLTCLDAEFQRRWKVSAAEIRERQSRGRSTATSARAAA